MLLTLALVVFAAAIAVIFSQEFIKGFKKIYGIKGAQLFLPLAIASWLVSAFDYWVLWALYYYREILHWVSTHFAKLMPFQWHAETIALIVLLTLISVVPSLLIDIHSRRYTLKPYTHTYLLSTLIFIVSAVLMIGF